MCALSLSHLQEDSTPKMILAVYPEAGVVRTVTAPRCVMTLFENS